MDPTTSPSEPSTLRRVDVTRTGPGRFRATNARGGTIDLGSGEDDDFTPVELLLAAIAGCVGVTVDAITARRAEPEAFDVAVTGHKVRDDDGATVLRDLELVLAAAFPAGEAGDRAREALPRTLRQTHERLCTVSRTVETGVPVEMRLAEGR